MKPSRRIFFDCAALLVLLAATGCSQEPIVGLLPNYGSDGTEESVYLNSQIQVNRFAGVESIKGDLVIGPSDDIVDLSPLAGLTSIGRTLRITGNQALTSLAPLGKLRGNISGFRVVNNEALKSLDGLGGLTVESEYTQVWIARNPSLVDFQDCPDLSRVPYLELGFPAAEADPTGLGPLTGAQGLELSGMVDGGIFAEFGPMPLLMNLYLWDVEGMVDFDLEEDYPTLDFIQIRNLPDLSRIGNLAGATKLAYLTVTNCPSLTSVGNLSGPARLKNLRLEHLESLAGLGSFAPLDSLRYLTIRELPNLASLAGLPELPSLENLNLRYLDGLADLTTFPMTTGLRELTLEGLTGVTSLASLPPLPPLEHISIYGMDSLTDLTGFPEVLPDALVGISNNGGLVDLTGLEILESCSWLAVTGCPELIVLTGLDNLDTITSWVSIRYNDVLTDVTALDPATTVAAVYIEGNAALDQCQALHHVADWPVTGTLSIGNNGPCQ